MLNFVCACTCLGGMLFGIGGASVLLCNFGCELCRYVRWVAYAGMQNEFCGDVRILIKNNNVIYKKE